MTTKEMIDSLLALLAIIVSWPVIVLIVILLVRKQLPTVFPDLASRITEGPLGFKFAEIDRKLDTIAATSTAQVEKVDALAEQVHRIESRIEFRSSPELTRGLQSDLKDTLGAFTEYLEAVGFKPPKGPVEIEVTSEVGDNAQYSPQENLIRIGPALVTDPDVTVLTFAQHALTVMLPNGEATPVGDVGLGIQHGLAGYFTCSFSGDPRVAEIWRPPFGLRNLDNDKTLAEIAPDGVHGNVYDIGEVWGGAFWEVRSHLGKTRADRALLAAWSQTDGEISSPSQFAERILSVLDADSGPVVTEQVREIFARRGVDVPT
jgi:hypothetical protein